MKIPVYLSVSTGITYRTKTEVIMKFDFECLDGRWYVVYPEYEGPFEDLEMVENADKML